ncbi:MAG TPA: hypothetical protein VFI24_06760 [Pyrinomonadaceae bacterium]|nr:hypothetical protein [Pyrinomonadaceae bacterium]
MDQPSKELHSSYVIEGGESAHSQANDLSAFLKFPSLSRLFQGPDRAALSEMRSRLMQTNQHLERVIRQGTKQDSERAMLASRSYNLTLKLLKELEDNLSDTTK